MQEIGNRPVIYNYWNYVEAINAFYRHQKQLNPDMSLEMLARRTKAFKRPLLSLVMAGKRTLQEEKIAPLSKALGMTRHEDRYLRSLVRFSQSRKPEDKSSALAEIAAQRPIAPSIEGDREVLLSRWYYIPLLELIKIPGFRADAKWIAKRFRNKITTEQINGALDMFLKLNLVTKKNDQWAVQQKILASTQDIPSRAIQAFHLNGLEKSKEALMELPIEDREMLGVTLTISKSEIQEIKEELRNFCRKIVMNRSGSIPVEEVANLNIQFHVLTKNEDV